jgi:hypothetical protein
MDATKLNALFKDYTSSERPRQKITILRELISVMMAWFPEWRRELEALERRVKAIQRGANWDAYTSYAVVGNWQVMSDEEFFVYNDLLAELDDIFTALVYLVEKMNYTMKESMRGGPNVIKRD